MASRKTTTRHGASARAGTTASSKSSARRAPARAAASPAARVPAARTSAKKASPRATTARAAGTRPAAKAKGKAAPARRKAQPLRVGGVPVLPVSIVVALVLLGWFMYPMARLHYQEQRKVDRLQAQLTAIQQRNARLKQDVERLKKAEGVEQAARELGMARKGEQLWVTMPEGGRPASEATTASPLRTAEVTPGLWTQLLDAVFGVGQ